MPSGGTGPAGHAYARKTFARFNATITTMFTGLIQAIGTITASSPTAAGKRFTIHLAQLASEKIALGDSICVSGVCLTVTKLHNDSADFDVITETLNRTSLGSKTVNSPVNLELSLRPDSFVGGHFVQGHIDALATVASIQSNPYDWRITFQVSPDLMPYFVPKGSVAVDGVSMTIAAVSENTFTLAVIPTTLEKTTLGKLKPNDPVNVETDILTRTVVNYLRHTAPIENKK